MTYQIIEAMLAGVPLTHESSFTRRTAILRRRPIGSEEIIRIGGGISEFDVHLQVLRNGASEGLVEDGIKISLEIGEQSLDIRLSLRNRAPFIRLRHERITLQWSVVLLRCVWGLV
jgi:hypothetical protein